MLTRENLYLYRQPVCSRFASCTNPLQACSIFLPNENSAFQMFTETFNGAGPPDKNVLA